MGILSSLRGLILGRSSSAAAPPPLGALTHAVRGLSAADHMWTQQIAEKLFGPFNPRYQPDWVYKRMMTDWSIGFCREVWLSGFSAVDYFFEDGGSAEIRAFLEKVVMRHLAQWREKQLQAIDYGRQTVETPWGVEDVSYEYVEGYSAPDASPGAGGKRANVVTRTKTGAYVLGEWRDIDPEHTAIHLTPLGDFDGVHYQGIDIPADRLLHIVSEPEFGNLFGRAQLVRAYNPWWWCNLAYLGVNRYLEKKGDPPIIGHAPGGYVSDELGNEQSTIKVTALGLANLRSGSSYVFPQEFDPQSKQPMYSVKVLEVAQRAPEYLQVIERHEKNKRTAMLMPGGLGDGGSFAADKVSQQILDRFFDRRCEAIILDPLNKRIIPRLALVNFPGAKAADVPRLRAGNFQTNGREMFSELFRAAISLQGVTPDGRTANIAQQVDWMRGLRKINVPVMPAALIPTAIQVSTGGAGAGRPPSIAPESGRPTAPGRPGMPSLSRALSRVADGEPAPVGGDPAAAWFQAAAAGLGRIDRLMTKTLDLAEAERQSLEAEIRNLLKKALSRAKTDEGALHADNRTIAAELGKKVEDLLEKSMFEDLLDDAEITDRALGLSRTVIPASPLAAAHADAFKSGADLLESLGIPPPKRSASRRLVKDVVRDAKSNGRGVVHRETRRVTEALDRMVIGQAPTETAAALADRYELPDRDFTASTVHHVRATARATLAAAGDAAGAESWLIATGPASEVDLLDRAPTGQVAEKLWTVKTSDELDAMFHDLVVNQGRPVTSWRNLGLNFGSSEMYLPIARELVAAIAAGALERRAAWNAARAKRQEALDELEAADEAEKARKKNRDAQTLDGRRPPQEVG